MTTSSVRQRLHEYIRFADDKKVKAIYTIIEEEMEGKRDIWTKKLLKEMNHRAKELKAGKAKGREWSIVQEKSTYLLSKKK